MGRERAAFTRSAGGGAKTVCHRPSAGCYSHLGDLQPRSICGAPSVLGARSEAGGQRAGAPGTSARHREPRAGSHTQSGSENRRGDGMAAQLRPRTEFFLGAAIVTSTSHKSVAQAGRSRLQGEPEQRPGKEAAASCRSVAVMESDQEREIVRDCIQRSRIAITPSPHMHYCTARRRVTCRPYVPRTPAPMFGHRLVAAPPPLSPPAHHSMVGGGGGEQPSSADIDW